MGRYKNLPIYKDSTIEQKVKILETQNHKNHLVGWAGVINYMVDNGWTFLISTPEPEHVMDFIFVRSFNKRELLNIKGD